MGRAGAPVEKRRGVASSIGKQLLGRSKLSRRMGVRDIASAIADLPFKAGVPGVECRSSILARYVVRGATKKHKEVMLRLAVGPRDIVIECCAGVKVEVSARGRRI
jgi:hypothetical protein